MNYQINTKTWSDSVKLFLVKEIMKETGLPFRMGAYWMKNLSDTVENGSTFDFPKTPYIEVNCFGEDNICIRKLTNMTEGNRKCLIEIVDEIIGSVLNKQEVCYG